MKQSLAYTMTEMQLLDGKMPSRLSKTHRILHKHSKYQLQFSIYHMYEWEWKENRIPLISSESYSI